MAERSEPESAFEEWWECDGKYYDPDFSGVHWYDKRKGLAAYAWMKAMAQSGNYIVDHEQSPRRVEFSNGRRVAISNSFDGISPYLDIKR